MGGGEGWGGEDLEAKKWVDRAAAGGGEEIKRWRSSKFLRNSFPATRVRLLSWRAHEMAATRKEVTSRN